MTKLLQSCHMKICDKKGPGSFVLWYSSSQTWNLFCCTFGGLLMLIVYALYFTKLWFGYFKCHTAAKSCVLLLFLRVPGATYWWSSITHHFLLKAGKKWKWLTFIVRYSGSLTLNTRVSVSQILIQENHRQLLYIIVSLLYHVWEGL